VNLSLLQHGWNRNHNRELLRISLEVVRHRQHRSVALTNENNLRRFVEQLRVSLGAVEPAKGQQRRAVP
jgi:hypothetical protein